MDLQCTNEASGGFYYISHLPRLQQCQQTTPEAEGNLTDISGALREGHVLTSHCDIPVSSTTHDTVMQTSQGPAADSQTVKYLFHLFRYLTGTESIATIMIYKIV